MGKYPVSPEKEAQLLTLMSELGVIEDDLEEKFIRASGPGGQKVNKTSSCVYIRHLPSGIEIKCQRERSQAMNRYFARRELCQRLQEMRDGEKSKREQAREKIRRQKRRRSRRQKERMLDEKHKVSEKKTLRAKPRAEDE